MYHPHIDQLPLFFSLWPDAPVDQGKYIKESNCNIDDDDRINDTWSL
jgi:hypothetical protein